MKTPRILKLLEQKRKSLVDRLEAEGFMKVKEGLHYNGKVYVEFDPTTEKIIRGYLG